MTTLIIGCGYLGERVGVRLRRGGEQVFGTVRSDARAAEIAAQGIEPVIADVLDRASLRGLPAAERVFYCVGFDRSAGCLDAVGLRGRAPERSRKPAARGESIRVCKLDRSLRPDRGRMGR